MPSILKLMAEFGINVSPFQAGMDKAAKAASHFQNNVGKEFGKEFGNKITGAMAGYFGFEALKKIIEDTIGAMAKMQDQSDQFNITTDDVQRLNIAAEEVGLTFEDAGAALNKLGTARQKALEGDQGKIDAFNKFGVGGMIGTNASDLDIMKQISKNLGGGELDSESLQQMRELFGRGGSRMVELLRGLNNQKVEQLISPEAIKAVDEADEAMKRAWRSQRALIAPAIGSVAEGIVAASEDKKSFGKDVGKGALRALLDPFGIFYKGKATNADLDKHIDNALPRTRMPKNSKASSVNSTVAGNEYWNAIMMGWDQEEGGPENFVNPKIARETAEMQQKAKSRMEEIALGHIRPTERITQLQSESKDIGSEIQRQQDMKLDGLFTEEVRQNNIANLKLQQLETDEKIYELKKKSESVNFSQFHKMTAGSGIDPSAYLAGTPAATGGPTAYGKTMLEYNEALKQIERNTGRNIIMLGR